MSILSDLFDIVPKVLTAVNGVHTAIPAATRETKLQVIMSAVTVAAKAGESFPNVMVQSISSLADLLLTIVEKIDPAVAPPGTITTTTTITTNPLPPPVSK